MIRKTSVNFPLVAIVAEGLLSRLSFGLITFTLPLYARHIGLSLTQIGLLISAGSTVSLCLKPLIGWVADRAGLKRTYIAAICVRSLVSLMYGFAVVPWELYMIRSVHGLSMSLRDPSANALIAEHGGEKSVASAFAWYQTAKTTAGAISKACAGILIVMTAGSYSMIFFLAFALSVLPLLVVIFFVQEERQAETDSHLEVQASPHPDSKRPAGKLMVFKCTGFGFLVAGTAEMLTSLFPVLATEYGGLSEAQAGMIYTFSTVVMIMAGPLFGFLADHVSGKLVLVIRSIANTFSSIAYVVVPTYWGIGIAKTVDDMGKAAFRPAWGALMAQIANSDKRTRAQTISWMSMGEDAGRAFAPLLAGFLWNTWGIAVLMGSRVLMAIITEAYAIAVTPWQGAQGLVPRFASRTNAGQLAPAAHISEDK